MTETPTTETLSGLPFSIEEEINNMIEQFQGADWLGSAEEFIQQDLETTVKEYHLARDMLETLEADLSAEEKLAPSHEDHKFLIAACQEYSGSRCHMLEERLRQIRLWKEGSGQQTEQDVPDGMPDAWPLVDVEWREWLSEQTSSQVDQSNAEFGIAVKDWGPLIPLLTAYTERKSS